MSGRVWALQNNVLLMLNRTTQSSKTLLRVVRFNVNKTLERNGGSGGTVPAVFVE